MSFDKSKFVNILNKFNKNKYTNNQLEEAIEAFAVLHCHNVSIVDILIIIGCTHKEWTNYIREGI